MRLIDADAIDFRNDSIIEFACSCFIDNEPTIDAEPVKHGHWVFHADTVGAFGTTRIEYFANCSVCGRKVHIRTLPGASWAHDKEDDDFIHAICAEEYPYCHCGAKMDEEAGHEDTVSG